MGGCLGRGVFWGADLSSWVGLGSAVVCFRERHPTLFDDKTVERLGHPVLLVTAKISSAGLGFGLFGGDACCFAVEESIQTQRTIVLRQDVTVMPAVAALGTR